MEEAQAIPTKPQVISRPKRPTGGNTERASEPKEGSGLTPSKPSPSSEALGVSLSNTASTLASNESCDSKDDVVATSSSIQENNTSSSSDSSPRHPNMIGTASHETTFGKASSPAITPTSQIKNGYRKRLSMFSNHSTSKVKCKAITAATKKKEKAEAPENNKPPISPQQKKDLDLENTNFSSLRCERDRIKYIRMMAERKIKVGHSEGWGMRIKALRSNGYSLFTRF